VPLIAYARVPTDEQTTVPQTDVLESRLLQYLSTSGERIAVLGSAPAVPDRVLDQP
jgi:hypothetical protein